MDISELFQHCEVAGMFFAWLVLNLKVTSPTGVIIYRFKGQYAKGEGPRSLTKVAELHSAPWSQPRILLHDTVINTGNDIMPRQNLPLQHARQPYIRYYLSLPTLQNESDQQVKLKSPAPQQQGPFRTPTWRPLHMRRSQKHIPACQQWPLC